MDMNKSMKSLNKSINRKLGSYKLPVVTKTSSRAKAAIITSLVVGFAGLFVALCSNSNTCCVGKKTDELID